MRWEQRYPALKCYGDVLSIEFSGKDLDFNAPYGSFEFLRCLLHCVGGALPKTEETIGFPWRSCVSVAAAYPTEIFVVLRDVSAGSGIFYFDVDCNKLLKIGTMTDVENISKSFADESLFARSRITFFCTSVLDRCVWRLRESSYRIALLDAGAVFGNLVNFSKALGCPVVPLGGFVDSIWESVFRLSSGEVPVAAFAVDPKLKGFIPDAVPSLDPFVAKEMLWLDVSFSLLLCQNQAERIPENIFRKRVSKKNTFFQKEYIPLPFAFDLEKEFNKAPEQWARKPHFNRNYKPSTISLDTFSSLIEVSLREKSSFFSAGYLKCFCLVFNVEGLEPGLYQYEPICHLLQAINLEVSEKLWEESHIIPEQIRYTSFVVLYGADLAQVTSVLGDRGYRYLLLDSGIINSSLHLYSEFVGLKAKGEYGYYEDFMKKIIGLEPKDSILYETMVGVPKND